MKCHLWGFNLLFALGFMCMLLCSDLGSLNFSLSCLIIFNITNHFTSLSTLIWTKCFITTCYLLCVCLYYNSDGLSFTSVQKHAQCIYNLCLHRNTALIVTCSVVADLIVKLAKDKFGAIHTEYQKVAMCVCVCVCWFPLLCCILLSLLYFYVLIISLTSEKKRFSLCSILLQCFWEVLCVDMHASFKWFLFCCFIASLFLWRHIASVFCMPSSSDLLWSPSAREHSPDPPGKFCTMYL